MQKVPHVPRAELVQCVKMAAETGKGRAQSDRERRWEEHRMSKTCEKVSGKNRRKAVKEGIGCWCGGNLAEWKGNTGYCAGAEKSFLNIADADKIRQNSRGRCDMLAL